MQRRARSNRQLDPRPQCRLAGHLVRGAKLWRSQHQTQSTPYLKPVRVATWLGDTSEKLPHWARRFQPEPALFYAQSLRFLKLWAACQCGGLMLATTIARFENHLAKAALCPRKPCGKRCQHSAYRQPAQPAWALAHCAQTAKAQCGCCQTHSS